MKAAGCYPLTQFVPLANGTKLKRWLRESWLIAKGLLYFLIDSIVFLIRRERNEGSLVVRLDALGDFILWAQAGVVIFEHLRKQGPVTLIANTQWASYAGELFDNIRVVPLDRRRFEIDLVYRISFLANIRRCSFHTVVMPTQAADTWGSDAIVRLSGAAARIGAEGNAANRHGWEHFWRRRWYTQLLVTTETRLWEPQSNANFTRTLCGILPNTAIPSIKLIRTVPKTVAARATFIVVPGAGKELRQWPIEYFARVAARLQKHTQWEIVVCGGHSEILIADRFSALLNRPFINLTGSTSLNEYIGAIANARFVLGNESSAIHIAAAQSIPAVCVLGGGHFGRFMPYPDDASIGHAPRTAFYPMFCFNCNWQCRWHVQKHQPVPCIAQVSPESVWDTILETLGTMEYTRYDDGSWSA